MPPKRNVLHLLPHLHLLLRFPYFSLTFSSLCVSFHPSLLSHPWICSYEIVPPPWVSTPPQSSHKLPLSTGRNDDGPRQLLRVGQYVPWLDAFVGGGDEAPLICLQVSCRISFWGNVVVSVEEKWQQGGSEWGEGCGGVGGYG